MSDIPASDRCIHWERIKKSGQYMHAIGVCGNEYPCQFKTKREDGKPTCRHGGAIKACKLTTQYRGES